MSEIPYNIFKNDFYDEKPAPKWAFTVEFILSPTLDRYTEPLQGTLTDDAPEFLKNLVSKLEKDTGFSLSEWMEKLSKSVQSIPIVHPKGAGAIPVWFLGYMRNYPGRYNTSGSLSVNFSDNRDRDIRCILEQLLHFDGLSYLKDRSNVYPTLSKKLWFDMIVRIYDVELVNQYDPTEGNDRVSEHGTVQAFRYDGCFVSKVGNEKNSYESSDQTRTVEATISYQRMRPI